MDRKDPALINYFNAIGVEKRLNKARMREHILKRYPEQITERIMKHISPYFNNFSFNLDINFYCDYVENFVNQSENVNNYIMT